MSDYYPNEARACYNRVSTIKLTKNTECIIKDAF